MDMLKRLSKIEKHLPPKREPRADYSDVPTEDLRFLVELGRKPETTWTPEERQKADKLAELVIWN